jgi:hypothetical protein
MQEERRMKGTRPGHLPPPSRPTGAGRTCAEPGCTTKLSIYNTATMCWQHAEVVFPNYRGKRLQPNKSRA